MAGENVAYLMKAKIVAGVKQSGEIAQQRKTRWRVSAAPALALAARSGRRSISIWNENNHRKI